VLIFNRQVRRQSPERSTPVDSIKSALPAACEIVKAGGDPDSSERSRADRRIPVRRAAALLAATLCLQVSKMSQLPSDGMTGMRRMVRCTIDGVQHCKLQVGGPVARRAMNESDDYLLLDVGVKR
jgi:hypothetical protein